MATFALRRRVLSGLNDLGAPGTVYHPSFADCALWLMGGAGITLVGGQVDAWKDQTANHNDYVADGTARADFSASDSDMGGRPTLIGNSIQGRVIGPSFAALTGGGEIHIVIKAPAATVLWRFGSDAAGDVYNVPDIYTAFATSTGRYAAGYAGAYGALTATHVLSVTSVPGEYTVYIDGNQIYTRATNTVSWDSSMSMILGYGGGSSGTAKTGAAAGTKQSCCIIYNRKLTSTERATVVTGLRSRYGI